jgi:hypothetical protein
MDWKKKRSRQENSERVHNKSGKKELGVSSISGERITVYYKDIQSRAFETADEPIPGSPCFLIPSADGRYTEPGTSNKVAFGYQIIARVKYGAEIISQITSNKSGEDYVVSHLCGTKFCLTASHIIIEDKWTNDERTKCHYFMQHLAKNHPDLFKLVLGKCPHEIPCLSEHPEKLVQERRSHKEGERQYYVIE